MMRNADVVEPVDTPLGRMVVTTTSLLPHPAHTSMYGRSSGSKPRLLAIAPCIASISAVHGGQVSSKKHPGSPIGTTKIDNLKSWTSGVDVEWEALKQLRNIAELPILAGHVAVMPDAHLGQGRNGWIRDPDEGCNHPGGRRR
jgi:hypothetical protein